MYGSSGKAWRTSHELFLGIERAHRSLQKKRTNPREPPRSIVVKFSSFQAKSKKAAYMRLGKRRKSSSNETNRHLAFCLSEFTGEHDNHNHYDS